MDNGPEFVAATLADWAQAHGVELEFIQPGWPMQNGFIERFNRSYREAVLNIYVFKTLAEARNGRRPGSQITTRYYRTAHMMI
jgi:putative transposase